MPHCRVHKRLPLGPTASQTNVHAFPRCPEVKHNTRINFYMKFKNRSMRWAGHVARMGEGRGVYRVLVGKPEGRRPLGKPRRRWEDNIRMDLREVGCGCVDWMELAQNRDMWCALVSAAMNLRVP